MAVAIQGHGGPLAEEARPDRTPGFAVPVAPRAAGKPAHQAAQVREAVPQRAEQARSIGQTRAVVHALGLTLHGERRDEGRPPRTAESHKCTTACPCFGAPAATTAAAATPDRG